MGFNKRILTNEKNNSGKDLEMNSDHAQTCIVFLAGMPGGIWCTTECGQMTNHPR